jgi:hypothetical protein
MLQLDSKLYFSSVAYNFYQQDFWNSLYKDAGSGGKFVLDISKRYKPQRFISRNGEWSLPWPQDIIPGFEMPEYDANYSRSFNDISDERAREIGELITSQNKKFTVMYSGGLDSTVVMTALIKNLTQEQLKNVSVCANSHSLVENPLFWKKFIWGKFKIFDSSFHKYDDIIEMGNHPITADEGDCIFGTMSFLDLQQNYDYYLTQVSSESRLRLASIKDKITSGDVHYSEYKDILIKYWSIPENPQLGQSWYDKFDKNIKTATVPVYSLHDYFWWVLFNLKFQSCSIRLALYLNDRVDYGETINKWAVNWFGSTAYQKWSMTNNNNGEKIEFGPTTYKMASRKYIYDLDKNDWYYFFKLKLGSLGPNVIFRQSISHLPLDMRPNARFGLDSNFNALSIDDPTVQEYIRHHITNYKRDW